MIQTIERAISGMQPQLRPKGVRPLGWLPIGLVSDAPGYSLHRDRSGALWVQVKLGITGDTCWYGPIAKDDPRHQELLDAVGTRQLGTVAAQTRRIAGGVVTLAAALPAIATGLSFMGSLAWPLDLFTHFRVQYLVSLTIATVILLLLKRAKMAIVFALLARR